MATTIIRTVPGNVAGTGSPISPIWPSVGGANGIYSVTGLFTDFSDNGAGTGNFSNTGAAAGTMIAFSGTSGPNAKPSWALADTFIEYPESMTGQAFSMLGHVAAAALFNSDWTNSGYLFKCGIQFYYDESTWDPNTATLSPVTTDSGTGLPAAQGIYEVDCRAPSNVTAQFRFNTKNVGGFVPGSAASNGTYAAAVVDTLQLNNGGSNALPDGHIQGNVWYEFAAWTRRSTGAGAVDGEIRFYLNGCCVMRVTNVEVWNYTASFVEKYFGLFSAWSATRTGWRWRVCAPLGLYICPAADLGTLLTKHWAENKTRGLHRRRHWSCAHTTGGDLTYSAINGGTLPARGRSLNINGAYPGVTEAIVRGTSTQGMLTSSPAVWGGSASDTVFGDDGWTWIAFPSLTPVNGGSSRVRVYAADETTVLLEATINDAGTGTFSGQGATILTGRTDLPANTRWGIVFGMTAGQCRILLLEQHDDGKTTRTCRTYSASCNYTAGAAIGRCEIQSLIGTNNTPVGHACIMVNSELDIITGDSYSSSRITETYAVSAVNQGTKTITVASMGTRLPTAGDRVRWRSSAGAVNDGVYTVASSTATTIVTVEAIPNSSATGNIDLVEPGWHTPSNGIGTTHDSYADALAIPSPYTHNPNGFTVLNGFMPIISWARSGGRLSEDLANIIPQNRLLPRFNLFVACNVVNNTSATSTDAAMAAEVNAAVTTFLQVADFCESRNGRFYCTEAPNLRDAGTAVNGTSNRRRRITPKQVSDQLQLRLALRGYPNGRVFFAAFSSLHEDTQLLIGTDGLHMDTAGYLVAGYSIRRSFEIAKLLSAFNSDGSIAAAVNGIASARSNRGSF